jgi:hypothetical protein
MTNPDYTHVVILADRTGSTGARTDPGRTRAMDFTDGIRGIIRDQAALPGRTTFSLVQFNRPWDGATSGLNAEKVTWFAPGDDPALRRWTITPYGDTPLLDAVGTVITETGQALAAMPEHERPVRVFFVVATDGEENVSREYKLGQVKEMVTRQHDEFGWEFAFIGVGIDAFAEAGGMGMAAGSTVTVDPSSSVAVAAAYAGTSDSMTRSRATGQAMNYTEQERAAANPDAK